MKTLNICTSARKTTALAAVLAFAFGVAATAPAQAYTVSGTQILDDAGKPVPLRGVNWFGFETPDGTVHGLWARNWKEMIDQIQASGFNAVRVPVCPATFRGEGSPPGGVINSNLNPDLVGLKSRQWLDVFLTELDRRGIYILLDHHRPDCQAISELWYTPAYSEAQWLDDLEYLAQKYAGLRNLVGLDLKNEPHGAATWGTGNVSTDWNLAAERAAQRILAVNPKLLIFVEGIATNPVCSGNQGIFWGGNLEPLKCKALDIPRNKLVLSPHVYGPDVFNQSYFDAPNFPANMPAIWDTHFGQFAKDYPVVLGEAGGKYGHGGSPKDKIWQDALVDYLKPRGMTGLFYWSWNPNSGDTGGILQDDWTTVWPDKLALLQRLWDGGTTTPPTNPPNPPTTPPGAVTATFKTNSDWGAGYCADVTVSNAGTQPAQWNVQLTVAGTINNLWGAVWNQAGTTLTATGQSHNATVQPGGTQNFGFCATR
ncbi:cellulase family glycosylhydrolase [Oxalobacteraceae bacterium OTU3REALA1]|nr:cellulase family glycosylhydrolase [Oxalobacteraceae bacterium OTU3REALA1]